MLSKRYLEINGNLEIPTCDSGKEFTSDVHNMGSIVVIGAGFTGLAASYEISRQGIPVTVLEKDNQVGGLAGNFQLGSQPLEKFYHHLFNHDKDVIELVTELGVKNQLLESPTKTGIYLNDRIFTLSKLIDLLRFKPLSLLNRIRLGLLVIKARRVKNWKKLESITAEEWLTNLCGWEVYKTVWRPLLKGKFGSFFSQISAVWFWNKLVLRGGSRGSHGEEVLAYYKGGMGALAEEIANKIRAGGGKIETGVTAESLLIKKGKIKGVRTSEGMIETEVVIATPSLPIIAGLIKFGVSTRYVEQLRRIKYLANVCLVLELSQSLSDIYWLNVNDPYFPFVGLIEHTNFQPAETYDGNHIVYLSKYLKETEPLYNMNKGELLNLALPHIKRMFPGFKQSWIRGYHVHKARYAQPVVECHYRKLMPSKQSPIAGLYIATTAQIYPEDRGVNYAIKHGKEAGRMAANQMNIFRSKAE